MIRRFSRHDSVSELTALLHESYAALAALGFNYMAADQSADLTRKRLTQGECYIAESDGRMIGTILFASPQRSNGSDWFNRPDVASFHQFGVLPAFQRQGIGGKLLTFTEAKALKAGAAEIALDTAEGAADLIEWYRRRGYREVGHLQWGGKSYRSVVMSKTLRR